KKLVSVFGKIESDIRAVDPQGASTSLGVPIENYNEKTNARMYRGTKAGDLKVSISGVDANTPVQAFSFNNKNYIAVLNPTGGGNYNVHDFYELTSNNQFVKVEDKQTLNTLNSQVNKFQKLDGSSYKNPFKIRPQVKYWETQPYKGMPAFVPVDVNEGWYAATKQTLPSFGNVKTFEDSGRVTSFWLCNIGANGVAQFDQGLGDDICEQVNLNTGQPTNLFPGLTSEKAASLISKAQKAIMEAAEKYSAGVKKVSILGESFDVGAPATGKLGTQCQDFMSPDDCYILFNVCDPVICPTSRCNLGGNYYVENVVQSGIIGSVALCLPNIKEGILVPVCLTGIHAGIEGYLSILKAHRDCLAESLKTGKHIGICDEIYSIYLCEFFWRQLAPVLNIIIPKMIELAYGQGTRGGGEYLTVQNAWNNMEKSTEYFTSYYAANAMKSFQIRNTEEVGTEVCKAFVSTKYPNLKLLLEPDSPTQFSAWFSEVPFTDATVPATSQYKVFYHIYAGEDAGTYYSVYLRNPPGTSFYESNPTISVASGYIPAGEYADETRDFTAPVGYKELCVRLNDQEKCGFKQVSSDFAINYIKDKYIAEQGSSSVTSEKECVSGTPSLYTLAQPNLQAGLEESAMPSIYNRGITRICSTDDPGKTTQPGRWKDVGYCDDTKIRCWIDTLDVADNIVAKDLRNETITAIDNMNVKNRIDVASADQPENSVAWIDALRANLSQFSQSYSEKSDWSLTSIQDMDVAIDRLASDINFRYSRAIFNEQKVQFLLMKAELYESAARILYSRFKNNLVAPVVPPQSSSSSSSASSSIVNQKVVEKSNIADGSVEYKFSGGLWSVRIKDNKNDQATYWYYSGGGWTQNQGNAKKIEGSGKADDPFKESGEVVGIVVNGEQYYLAYWYSSAWHNSPQQIQPASVDTTSSVAQSISLDVENLKKGVVKLKFGTPSSSQIIVRDGDLAMESSYDTGTGFIVSTSDKLSYVTALHVLGTQNSIRSWPYGGSSDYGYVSTLVLKEPNKDIAFLETALKTGELGTSSLKLGDSSSVRVNDAVGIIGYSGQTGSNVSSLTGKVLSIESRGNYGRLIFTDIKVAPGFSGSPMFNSNGEVIGVVILAKNDWMTAIAMPINEVKSSFNSKIR
ncbi:MAG: serine protease, partial [Nanoarchaeota archaeon]|nr:serine protease [Nanoarchaeota archaeon]